VPDRFEDHRGVIQDLPWPLDGITLITTRKGAVRGNHIHAQTHQWTYILTGKLRSVMDIHGGRQETISGPYTLLSEPPGVPHAWEALEDTMVLVFTKGPRSGKDYESDTQRLEVPLIEPPAV
jgi:quercetin dioxygenase-like cupin family protein